jgi:RNA polymerase sigma-70 factor (ECF subfamily)
METGNNFADMPDHELMERLKTAPSDEVMRGFDVIVGRYKNPIVTFLYRYVGDFRTAEDLAQEAFLRVFRKIDTYNHTAKFSTWLYTIASNLAKDEFKYRSRHPAKSVDWSSGGAGGTTRNVPELKADTTHSLPERQVEKGEARENVNRVLKLLEENDRQILILKDVQGLSYVEISQVLDLPMGTVKSRIARARFAFKETWKRMEF